MVPVGISYARALAYPGEASVAQRSVDWLRDQGLGPVVNWVENWWYTRDVPSNVPFQPHLVSVSPAEGDPATPAPIRPLSTVVSPAGALCEGHWTVGAASPGGAPRMYATYLRPDAAHASVVAAVARFDQRLVRTELFAGTREPAPDRSPGRGMVPRELRPSLVATFNSGFKLADTHDGFYTDRRETRPLREGVASLVIDNDGRVSVGAWGRDVRLAPVIKSVRQNLALIVDGGRVVSGLEVNTDQRWGSPKNQLQYTWRSAVGVDAAGFLYYVAGDQLTLGTLARALAATGAVRGMELDIHPNAVHLFAYQHPGAGEPDATKLLASMRGPRDRYLIADRRDFLAVAAR